LQERVLDFWNSASGSAWLKQRGEKSSNSDLDESQRPRRMSTMRRQTYQTGVQKNKKAADYGKVFGREGM
jgi:hypothetical protein